MHSYLSIDTASTSDITDYYAQSIADQSQTKTSGFLVGHKFHCWEGCHGLIDTNWAPESGVQDISTKTISSKSHFV